MSRMAQNRLQWEKEQEKKNNSGSPPDTRSLASKLWDAVNIIDGGRSWFTAEPDEESKKKSSKEQLKDTWFKLGEDYGPIVRALSGENVREQERLSQRLSIGSKAFENYTKAYREGKISKERYDKLVASLEEDDEKTMAAVKEVNKDDTRRTLASAATLALDIGTAGIGGKAAKESVKQGSKMALNRKLARQSMKGGTIDEGMKVGLASGLASGATQEDADLQSILGAGIAGTAMGGAIPAITTSAGHVMKPLGQEGSVANPLYRHATTADKVDSILNDGKLKAGRQLDGPGGTSGRPVPVDPNDFDTNPGVFMDTESSKPWLRKGQENLEIHFNEETIKKQGDIKTSGTQAVVANDIPVTPETVAEVRVGSEEVAQKFRDKGFKNVTVDKELNLTKEVDAPLGSPAGSRPATAAASVTAPTEATLEAPLQLRVLDDVQGEARVRTPGGDVTPPKQLNKTSTEIGAEYIGNDIDRLSKEAGIDVDSLDTRALQAIEGRVQANKGQRIRRSFANQFQDSLTVAAKTVGKPGVDFVYNMLKGEKFKRDALERLRDPLSDIQKLGKKLTGGGRFKKASLAAKRDIGARIGKALDDRANAAQYLRNADEVKLYEKYVEVFDYIKQIREGFGLEVQENYRPWVKMREVSEPPAWLSQSLTSKNVNTMSRFSKERILTEASDDVDDNLLDMIYGYVNSQLNEFAYDAPVKKFKKDMGSLPASAIADERGLREGIDYLATLTQQAVNPKGKDEISKFITGMGNRVYGSVLPFNPRLTLQNKTQKWAANSRVSKGAVKLAKKIDDSIFKDLEGGLVFGDQTVFGQLEDVSAGATTAKRGLRDKVQSLDFYQKSEADNVTSSFRKGAAQAAVESDVFKAARKAGMSRKEAAEAALKDPAVRELAIQRGNMVVNDTQFGASHLARPAALRSEGSVLGIPIKSLTMFTRFPIGMSQHILETIDGKAARALDVLKNGDPRAVPIAEMRSSYGVLRDSMKDSLKAIDAGVDVGVPKKVLQEQISTIDKNLKIIDKALKSKSQVRSGKTIKNFAKMWTAAAAIQVIFDGGIQSFANDPGGQGAEALDRTDPTATDMVFGRNSRLGGMTSAAIPVNKYGLNERALTNYIPGVGLAVNRARDVKKLADSLMGGDDE